jgi:putative hemolysin
MTQDIERHLSVRHLSVRLAETDREVRAAQTLRYRVFYENMGAAANEAVADAKRDFDRFDAFCDHLIVVDDSIDDPDRRIVGTYRLLPGRRAVETCGFYSEAEFDLSPLQNYPGETLELGRSCVDPDHRTKFVLQLLWQGIYGYLVDNKIDLMFGCASIPGTDVEGAALTLSYLRHYHAAPKRWRPRADRERYIEMDRVAKDRIDVRAALRGIPPLIKGYLRIGGVIGEGAVIDDAFNTIDVCLLVETDQVPDRYRSHYAKGYDDHAREPEAPRPRARGAAIS